MLGERCGRSLFTTTRSVIQYSIMDGVFQEHALLPGLEFRKRKKLRHCSCGSKRQKLGPWP